jgi:hypothetical protein
VQVICEAIPWVTEPDAANVMAAHQRSLSFAAMIGLAFYTHATSLGVGDVQYVSFVSFKGLPLQGLGSIESGGSWW